MAQAHVVYTTPNGNGSSAPLFEGRKFWFSQTVPTRSWMIEQVQANGGEIVPLEKYADVKIVDHIKSKNKPPGSYSFEYVTHSLRNGILEDLEKHAVGPLEGTLRPVGSARPTKGSRTPFSAEDDRILHKWVTDYQRKGGSILGNEIYKQLERANNRHTFQSWRDRWIKYVSLRPQPSGSQVSVPAAPPTPPLDIPHADGTVEGPPRNEPDWTADDFSFLLAQVGDFLKLDQDMLEEVFGGIARKHSSHSASQWKAFYHDKILPFHLSLSAQGESAKSEKATVRDIPTKPHAPKAQQTKPEDITRAVKRESVTPQPDSTPPTRERSPVLSPGDAVDRRASSVDHISADYALSPSFQSAKRKRQDDIPPAPDFPSDHSPKLKRVRQNVEVERHDRRPSSVDCASSSSSMHQSDSESLLLPSMEDVIYRRAADPTRGEQFTPTTESYLDPETLDLAVAAPDGGWDPGIISEDAQASLESALPVHDRTDRLDTQALLDGHTQILDFEVPEPEGGWDEEEEPLPLPEEIQSSLPPVAEETSPEHRRSPVPDTDDDSVELNDWIDSLIARGCHEDDVLLALKCTSMTIPLAQVVLIALTKGEEVPHNVPGVWTQKDDEVLRGNDARAIKAMEEKHGGRAFAERVKFLENYLAPDEEA
ncbi:MAG: hypothetical protein M1817_003133 [Caeruleum heppii]|nr:MAG: hypothetical protein M1817_003133 [Caeruleum heppii]